MNYVDLVFLRLPWDISISICLILVALLFAGYLIKKKKNEIIDDLWSYYLLSGSISIVAVLLILVGLSLNTKSTILEKLASGEVIVGIAIVTPTFFTWLKVDKEKREEIEKNLLREEYDKWLDDLSEKELDLGMRVKLDALLSRSERVRDNVIDYLSLFIVIQEKLNSGSECSDSKEWRRINTTILRKIKSKDPQKFVNLKESVLTSEFMKKLKYIDFNDKVSSELLSFRVYPDNFEYSNCVFCLEKTQENTVFFFTKECKFSRCIFDDLEKFEVLFSNNSMNYTIDYYYLKETIDSGVYDKITYENGSKDGNFIVLSEKKELNLDESKIEESRKESKIDEFKTENLEEDEEKRYRPILSRQSIQGLDEIKLEQYELKSEQSREEKEGSEAELAKGKIEEKEGSKAELTKGKIEEEEGSKAELAKGKIEEKEESKAELAKGKIEEEEESKAELAKGKIEEEEGSKKVYDKRNFGLNKPINSYLEGGQTYKVQICKGNINESIFDKIKTKIKGEKDYLNLNKNIIISRSLSYIPPSIHKKDSYIWYSYNTLDKNAINENIEYLIFAVQSDANNKEFECLVFNKKQFQELYGNKFQNIRRSDSGRWHFIFTEYRE